MVPNPTSVRAFTYSFIGKLPLKQSARKRASFLSVSFIFCSHVGSLITSFPCGVNTRYISSMARFKSSALKMLNKQFCAATSMLLSSTGRFKASPFLRVTNSDLNQGFCASAILKFAAEASNISSTTSTPTTPPF